MSAKAFNFLAEDQRTKARGEFAATAATLGEAFKRGAPALPAIFADPAPGLRMFGFKFRNGLTGELSGFLGQGVTVAEAWSDGLKGTRETFRPKNDGKHRPAVGLYVWQPPAAGDVHAVRSSVSRSVEQFEGDESHAQELARLAREAAAKLAAQQGIAA